MYSITKDSREFPHRTREQGLIDMLITHSMGERINGTPAADHLMEYGLSAHILVTPDGRIIELVDPEYTAFHAGVSVWGDRQNLNRFSIGIEFLVVGDHNWDSFVDAIEQPESFPQVQYKAAAWWAMQYIPEFDISYDHVLRHSDVSGTDVRPDNPKLDPGDGFDLDYFKQQLGVFAPSSTGMY